MDKIISTVTMEVTEANSASEKSAPLNSPTYKDGNGMADSDALALKSMGYDPSLRRNYSKISVLSVAYSLTNSWFGISAALITGINSGGPVLIVYGVIGLALISFCVGVSLSELASAMPNAGGQYFWANELAPKIGQAKDEDYQKMDEDLQNNRARILRQQGWDRVLSYMTGWFAWAGAIFTSASVSLACASGVVGCYQLSHPDFAIEAWHVVVAYEVINAFSFIFNTHAKPLPLIAQISFWTSIISFFVILVAVPSKAPTHQNAKFVFAEFFNNTGWTQNGIAFIVGLINTNYAYACLDCATHLAEELPRPERAIPFAILGTVVIGFVTAWTFSIALFFSISDLDAITGTSTLVPVLELFYQALGSKAGAIVLEALVIATGIWCLVACHTWQTRLCWSFARDGGIPFSKVFARVEKGRGDVPLAAHGLSWFIVSALGLLYLGSSTAFNSMVTACIVLLYVSYSIPVICLLIKGRHNIKKGPFWMGKFGLFSNVVLLCWTLFTLVMYSFPVYYPAKSSTMNYVSAVYGVVILIMLIDWSTRGRRHYRGQLARHEDAVAKIGSEGPKNDYRSGGDSWGSSAG